MLLLLAEKNFENNGNFMFKVFFCFIKQLLNPLTMNEIELLLVTLPLIISSI